MSNPFKKKEPTVLDEAIDDTIAEYRMVMSGDTDEAEKVAKNLKTLAEVKSGLDAKHDSDPRILVAIIGAISSLGGILMITQHERLHVLASKALPFIPKM